MADYSVLIKAELDKSSFNKIRNDLQNLPPIQIRVSLDGNIRDIRSQIENLRQQISSIGNIVPNVNGLNNVRNCLTQISSINLRTNYQQLSNMQRALDNFGFNRNSINTVTQDIQNMNIEVSRITTNLQRNGRVRINIQGIDELGRAISSIREVAQVAGAGADGAVFKTVIRDLGTTVSQSFRTSADEIRERTQEVNQSFSELRTIATNMGNLQFKIGKLDSTTNINQIRELESQLNSFQQEYLRIYNSVENELSENQFNQLEAIVSRTRERINELKTSLAEGINLKIDNGSVLNEFDKINSSMDKIKSASKETTEAFSNLDVSYKNLTKEQENYNNVIRNNNSTDTERLQAANRLIEANARYENSLKTLKNQIDINTRAENENNEAKNLQNRKTIFENQITAFKTKYSASLKQYGSQIDEIISKIKDADAQTLKNLIAQFKALGLEIESNGLKTKSFGDTLKSKFISNLSQYISKQTAIYKAIKYIKEMCNNVKEIDTAMTELYRVTDLSTNQYSALFDKMTQSAKNYGSTVSELINSTASWVRLGFDSNDSVRLAEITSMYQHVTDLDESTAVDNLVTAYKGFQESLLELNGGSATKSIEMVTDIYDKLGRYNCP